MHTLPLDEARDDCNIFQLDATKQKRKEIEENVVVRTVFSPSKEGFTAVCSEKEKKTNIYVPWYECNNSAITQHIKKGTHKSLRVKLCAVQIACLCCWFTFQLPTTAVLGLVEGMDDARALPTNSSPGSCLQTFGSSHSSPNLNAPSRSNTDSRCVGWRDGKCNH